MILLPFLHDAGACDRMTFGLLRGSDIDIESSRRPSIPSWPGWRTLVSRGDNR